MSDSNMDKNYEKNFTDMELMSRLLEYVKPYWYLFLISLILLIAITGLELLNPYLLKVAIDDHITLENRNIYRVEDDKGLEDILKIDGENYLIEDSYKKQKNNIEYEEVYKIKKESGDFYIKGNGEQILINDKEYKEIRNQDISGVNQVAFMFFFVILFSFVFSYVQEYLLNYTGQRIIYNIRNDVFNHIQNLSLSFFDNTAIGRLVTRVNNDTETLNEMFTSVLVNLFKDIFTLVGIIIIMLKMDYRLALYSFIFLPIFFLISIKFRDSIRVAYGNFRKQLSIVNTSLNENISGMTTIQIFNKEEKINKSFDEINKDYLDAAYEEVRVHALLRPVIEVVRSLAIAMLVYAGGNRVIDGGLEFGTLYIFIEYMQRFFQPIFELTEKYNIIQSAMTSSERIFTILDNDEIIHNLEETKELSDVKGKIEFKNVWFAYEDEDWILKDISFTIEPGDSVAFVGPTGAGKTTIINLVTRFYDIQKGEILLDGINIKEVDKFELRENIGVVLQDVFMFSGTIEDNIKLHSPEITREKVIEVSKHVNAHRFISKLPKGYDEPVMERGATLSAGERQLLSFARTLAHEPKVLILDEATANIDTETELLIQDAIEKIIKDRTSIAIAHRLSTIQYVDKIIVLNKGEIEEEGTHQELLENKGMYYNLYKLQFNEKDTK